MSDIDFQNGFIVGMATRGVTRSGLMYEPLAWNDNGVFSYFYLDFKHPMAAFSAGMLTESIIVHDSVQLQITGFEKLSTSVFRLFCNVDGKVNGVTVLNKATSLLSFASGAKLPPFSVHFFVSGIVSYIRMKYAYETIVLGRHLAYDRIDENAVINNTTDITIAANGDSTVFSVPVCASGATEAVLIAFT